MPAKKRTTKPKRGQKTSIGARKGASKGFARAVVPPTQKQKQAQVVNVRLGASKSDRIPAPIILGGGGGTTQFIPQYIQPPQQPQGFNIGGMQDVRDIIKSSIQDALAYRIPNVPMSPFPLSQYQQGQESLMDSNFTSAQGSKASIPSTFNDTFSDISEPSQLSWGQIYTPKPEDFGEFSSPQEKTKSTIMENLPQPQASPKPESQQGQTITEEQYVSLVKPIESSFDEPSPLISAIRPLIKQKPVPFLSPIAEESSMGEESSPSPQMTEAERLREEKRQRDREYYQANQARILAQKKAAKAAKKNAK